MAGTGIPCTSGWFGSSCQYKCRCTGNSCDVDGTCTGNSGCQLNWFGPACQYYNLIKDAVVKTPPFSYLAARVTDQNETTCITDDINVWNRVSSINVTWRTSQQAMTWLRIRGSNAETLKRISIQLQRAGTEVECDLFTSVVDGRTVDLHCRQNVLVDTMTLSGDGLLGLCDLYLSGGRNVALRQPTRQSSTFVSSRYKLSYNQTRPETVVDGNTGGDMVRHGCSHTDYEDSPWWSLELPVEKIVFRYVIYNRDVEPNRLNGFYLDSYAMNGSRVFQHIDQSRAKKIYNIIAADVRQPVVQVLIMLNRKGILTLCEVEVYGDSVCPTGRYGRDCEKPCNCGVKDEPCVVSTGACPSGCGPGFYGQGCLTECSATFYGQDCKLPCSSDCQDASCHHITGVCHDCPLGKLGDQCNQNCTLGTYGKKCTSSCSPNCRTNQDCDSRSGECNGGCADGYTGLLCNESCPNSTYGENCMFNCSRSCLVDVSSKSTVCHHITGTCHLGCVPEYQGLTCSEFKSTSGSIAAGVVAGPIIVLILMAVVIILGVFLWRKRKRSKDQIVLTQSASQVTETDSVHSVPQQIVKDDKPPAYSNLCRVSSSLDTISEAVYCNSLPTLDKTAIPVNDLNDFIQRHSKEYFSEQFKKIPTSSNVSMAVGQSPENKNKNRYKNICAYDHSRVHLNVDSEKGYGDYINASYIQGYKKNKSFIASQGPNKVMIDDFVRLLWEQKTEVVVMLTNLVEEGKMKCEKYWPDTGEITFGEISIKLITTKTSSDYIIRKLQLKQENEPGHIVTQFHFTAWPDKGIPVSPWSLVDFEQRVTSEASSNKPIVVHCSAGVGRTGTFIALSNLIQEAKATGQMDFYSNLGKLRQDRVSMIQTLEQYMFLHEAAQVAMVCARTIVTSTNITQRIQSLEKQCTAGKTKMEKEYKDVCEVCPSESSQEEEGSGGSYQAYLNNKTVVNHMKNRFPSILPKENCRPHLNCETKEMGDYINAVLIPNLTQQKRQVLTQLPLPTTVQDFWRLATQLNVSLIVAVELDLNDETVGVYMPKEDGESLHCGLFQVETTSERSDAMCKETALTVRKQKRRKSSLSLSAAGHKVIEVYNMTHIQVLKCDLDIDRLLTVVQKIRSCSSSDPSRKTLFMCRNGAEHSGLLCALSLLLERMDTNSQVSVPLVVGSIKAVRPQVIPTFDQYKSLYQVLKMHCEDSTSMTYSNSASLQEAIRASIKSSRAVPMEENVYANS